eukprot:7386109-Prymnesium_polylepis.1
MQELMINSLPNRASSVEYFVTICPTVKHHNTSKQCDKMTYHKRCWCRAEVRLLSARTRPGLPSMGNARLICASDDWENLSALSTRQVMSYWARQGTECMFYTDGSENAGLKAMAPNGVTEDFLENVGVFGGELTCCRLGHHGGTTPCDKEELMRPMCKFRSVLLPRRGAQWMGGYSHIHMPTTCTAGSLSEHSAAS